MADKNRKQEFAVIGLDRFGYSLACRLESLGHAVLGIDIDPAKVQFIANAVTEAVILDATNEEALKQVDITAFDTVVVAIGHNFEPSALVTATLKSMGVKNIVCQASTDRHRDILLHIGADRVVQPLEDSGERLANELSTPGMMDSISLDEHHAIVEIKTPPGLVSKKLAHCDIYHVTILLVKRSDKLTISPPPDFVIQEDDLLIVLGETTHIHEFSTLA
jgi:trk system potassium uptake protein TrkA